MSDRKEPIWTAPAIVTEIGRGDDGADMVGLQMYGRNTVLPVNLPSEARQIGAHLGRRATVALLVAAEDEQSIEEQIVWHRTEVDRLRELLAAKAPDEREARVEVGRATVVITCRGADAEQAVVARAAEIMAGEDTARRVADVKRDLDRANAERALLVRMMRSALLVIDAVHAAEAAGQVMVSATRGTRWDDLRAFATDPHVRKWLLDNEVDDRAFVAAVKVCEEGDARDKANASGESAEDGAPESSS